MTSIEKIQGLPEERPIRIKSKLPKLIRFITSDSSKPTKLQVYTHHLDLLLALRI